MANVQHSVLTGSSLHENKGVSSATTNTVATCVSNATVWAKLTASNLTGTGNSFGAQLLHVQDEQLTGVDGGASVTGAWTKRVLNTVKTNEITSSTLTSSVISLPVGTYYIKARCPFYRTDLTQLRLRNTTDSADLVIGGSAYFLNNADGDQGDAWLEGRFPLLGTKNVELQYQATSVHSTGLGKGNTFGTQVFGQVYIWKVI